MAWVNLNDVFVPETGGTVSGDLNVDGSLIINDGKGGGTTLNVANEISDLHNECSEYKILTSQGAYWMDDTQTLLFKEGEYVKTQKHGIILVWSRFDLDANQAADSDISYTFIPKTHTMFLNSSGILCPVGSTQWSSDPFGTKYVYVEDDTSAGRGKIRGHSLNGSDSTLKKYVLRYVIGI